MPSPRCEGPLFLILTRVVLYNNVITVNLVISVPFGGLFPVILSNLRVLEGMLSSTMTLELKRTAHNYSTHTCI